jgi:hypothetical protein
VELLHQGEIGKVGTEQHTNHTSIVDAERLLTKDAERFLTPAQRLVLDAALLPKCL